MCVFEPMIRRGLKVVGQIRGCYSRVPCCLTGKGFECFLFCDLNQVGITIAKKKSIYCILLPYHIHPLTHTYANVLISHFNFPINICKRKVNVLNVYCPRSSLIVNRNLKLFEITYEFSFSK